MTWPAWARGCSRPTIHCFRARTSTLDTEPRLFVRTTGGIFHIVPPVDDFRRVALAEAHSGIEELARNYKGLRNSRSSTFLWPCIHLPPMLHKRADYGPRLT